MSLLELQQGSTEWLQARCGSLGASSVHEAVARTKTGWGASRANLMARLIAERLTGIPQETYQNAAMLRGSEKEPEARDMYAFMFDTEVREVGLALHPTIEGTHASPDGLVGDDGLVEIKSPNSATHIETLLTEKIDRKYIIQMNWQMRCCDRQWCDFVSFDDRLPADLQLWVKRVHRDDDLISELEGQVAEFLAELAEKIRRLETLRAVA